MRYRIIAILILLLSCTMIQAEESLTSEIFAGTNKIIFKEILYHNKTLFTVSDKAEISCFIKSIKLKTKKPCACDHVLIAVFKQKDTQVEVDFCDHCFEFKYDGRRYECEMPKAFYKLFQQGLKKHKVKLE